MEDEDEERSLTLTEEVPDNVDVAEGIIDAKDERMKRIRPSIISSGMSGMFITLSFAVAFSREVVAWEDAEAAAAAL